MSALHVVCRFGMLRRWSGVVTLWIYMSLLVAMVTAERTCDLDFDDIGSLALLAPTVVEGRARRVVYDTGEPQGIIADSSQGISVVFDRLKLYKGQLMESAGEVRSIEVRYFGITADVEACVAQLPEIHRSYILFVRRNDSQVDVASMNVSNSENEARRQRGRYLLTAFPVRNTRRNIATVMQYTNCSRCGM